MSGSGSDIFMSDASSRHGSPLARYQRGRDRDDASGFPSAPSRQRLNGSTPDSMSSWSRVSDGSLAASVRTLDSTPSQPPQASQLGFDRGAEVQQPVVATRLAQAVHLLPNGSSKRAQAANTLAAVNNIEPAKTFWRREHPSKAFPVELNDQTIGNVTHPHPT
jgi:hypothetical protein